MATDKGKSATESILDALKQFGLNNPPGPAEDHAEMKVLTSSFGFSGGFSRDLDFLKTMVETLRRHFVYEFGKKIIEELGNSTPDTRPVIMGSSAKIFYELSANHYTLTIRIYYLPRKFATLYILKQPTSFDLDFGFPPPKPEKPDKSKGISVKAKKVPKKS